MKFALIIPDGCADEPQESLEGKTPLEAAHTPAMDALAAVGVVGRANHVPAHLPAGSAVANMSLLGYDPVENFTGRAPLEAAAQGIELGPDDWAIRCNLVTVEDQIMRDFTADHISTDEAKQLLADAQLFLDADIQQFVPGVSYRNLLIWRGAKQPAPFTTDTRTTPPHDLTDKSVLDDFPRGPGSDLLTAWMSDSVSRFADHAVNQARRDAGRLPASNIWLWGLGRQPSLPPFQQAYGLRGAMITAVDLLRGLGKLIGWRGIEVEGATGYLDTNYAGKGAAAIKALDDPDTDIVCVHIEAPDEASHEGDVTEKVRALEQIDQHIVTPIYESLQKQSDWRILVTPDHPTPLRTKTHSHGAVPFALAGEGIATDSIKTYGDTVAAQSELAFEHGHKLMGFFLGR